MTSDAQALLDQAQDRHNAGDLMGAESLYRDLIARWPDSPQAARALTNRGVVAQASGRRDEALALHDRALSLCPDLAEAWCNRGDLLSDLDRLDEAEADFARAAQLSPGLAPAWFNRANVLMRLGRIGEAEPCYGQAARLLPAHPVVREQLARCRSDLGALMQQDGRIAEAKAMLNAAIAASPLHAAAHYNLGNTYYGEGAAAQAMACWRRAAELDPSLDAAIANWLNGLHYLPEATGAGIAQAHGRAMDRRFPAPLRAAPHGNDRDPERVIRVGYVSADFRRHPLGLLMRPVLAGHDPDRVFSIGYATRPGGDEITDELRSNARLWREAAELDDDALARLIRNDAIDILVDLDGHTAANRLGLFALRPAPVQMGWLGYPFTTGLAAMDYALMDRATVPPEAEGWFREKVLFLPGSRLCYQGPEHPRPEPPPMLARGFVTFGSFNNIAKLNDGVVASWSRILGRVPGARLRLKWPHLAQAEVADRMRAAFAAHGIGPDRLDLRGNSPPEELLAEYGAVDIALDPFPYCGAFTSCEALWMGVPVVTLPGPRPFSRQSLALLTALGLEAELSRTDLAAYEDLAVDLAGRPDSLADLRRELRPAMALHLGDGPAHVAAVEDVFRRVWRQWCAPK